VQHKCHKSHLKNIIVKVLLRLFILGTEHCEHFNYTFMFENTYLNHKNEVKSFYHKSFLVFFYSERAPGDNDTYNSDTHTHSSLSLSLAQGFPLITSGWSFILIKTQQFIVCVQSQLNFSSHNSS
jgi:hypothetical protein